MDDLQLLLNISLDIDLKYKETPYKKALQDAMTLVVCAMDNYRKDLIEKDTVEQQERCLL